MFYKWRKSWSDRIGINLSKSWRDWQVIHGSKGRYFFVKGFPVLRKKLLLHVDKFVAQKSNFIFQFLCRLIQNMNLIYLTLANKTISNSKAFLVQVQKHKFAIDFNTNILVKFWIMWQKLFYLENNEFRYIYEITLRGTMLCRCLLLASALLFMSSISYPQTQHLYLSTYTYKTGSFK